TRNTPVTPLFVTENKALVCGKSTSEIPLLWDTILLFQTLYESNISALRAKSAAYRDLCASVQALSQEPFGAARVATCMAGPRRVGAFEAGTAGCA
ncbi:MAG: hypothetical protein ABSG10_02670, partial [Terracidiphilus sp.]